MNLPRQVSVQNSERRGQYEAAARRAGLHNLIPSDSSDLEESRSSLAFYLRKYRSRAWVTPYAEVERLKQQSRPRQNGGRRCFCSAALYERRVIQEERRRPTTARAPAA